MSIAPKIKNLKIFLKIILKKVLNVIININNSVNHITNNHIDYIKQLELLMKTWTYKYTNSLPSKEDFNEANAIFPDAYKQNPTHETVVLPFIEIAILYYTNLIEQEEKDKRDVSVYKKTLQSYKRRLPWQFQEFLFL